jgi:hypothetical protein
MNIFKYRFQIAIENFFKTLISIVKMALWVRGKGAKVTDFSVAQHFVILGNGPSLEEEIKDLNFERGNLELICVNHYPSTSLFETTKPKFYITGAPDLWLDDIEQTFVDNSNKLFNNIAEKTSWDFHLFIPLEAKEYKRWQEPLLKNPKVKIHYFNNNAVEGLQWFNHFCFYRQLGMPRPHNVMIPCMSLTIDKKAKSILLLGVGHTWLGEISVTEDNEVLLNQKHFYDRDISKPTALDKKGKDKRKLYEVLSKFTLAFYGYFVIKDYAEAKNVKIYNGTVGSFIDAFERISPKKYLQAIK